MDNPHQPTVQFIFSTDLTRIVKDKGSEAAPVIDVKEDENRKKTPKPSLMTSLVAGAAAGIIVDLSLFPIDTIKTRLQSQQGFKVAGGFQGVYKGVMTVLVGSAPATSVFFGSYNGIINCMTEEYKGMPESWIHFIAATTSEIVSSSIRVPIEVIKQRTQTSIANAKPWDILKQIWILEGFSGLYRGFTTTVLREIPFAAIQFPLWEYFKKCISVKHQRPVTTFETAYCGAAAGGISAALTTPLDVIKTRTMLASNEMAREHGRFLSFYVTKELIYERGLNGLFAGIVPRVIWITLGGFIYFGIYQFIKEICEEQTLIPVGSREDPYMVLNEELKKATSNQKLMAQSAAPYSDEDDLNGGDSVGPQFSNDARESEWAESPELSGQLVDPYDEGK